MDLVFLSFLDSLAQDSGVEVAAASPPDPSFSLLDPPVVVWFQGAVLGSRFVDLPRCLGGYEPSTQRLESSRVPLLVDASHLEGYLVRVRASIIGGWSFNGLFLDWVIYCLVMAVPEISLSFAASLPGVIFQSFFEAPGKLLR